MKVTISLDDDLMARVDEHAKRNYTSRSGLIAIALMQYLNKDDMVVAIKELAISMRKIADTGKIDEETMKQLEDYERLCKMFVGAKVN